MNIFSNTYAVFFVNGLIYATEISRALRERERAKESRSYREVSGGD
jgi:hypothetical protein